MIITTMMHNSRIDTSNGALPRKYAKYIHIQQNKLVCKFQIYFYSTKKTAATTNNLVLVIISIYHQSSKSTKNVYSTTVCYLEFKHHVFFIRLNAVKCLYTYAWIRCIIAKFKKKFKSAKCYNKNRNKKTAESLHTALHNASK